MLLIKLVFHKDKTQVQTPTHTKSLLPTLSSAQISLSQHLFGPPSWQNCPKGGPNKCCDKLICLDHLSDNFARQEDMLIKI